jgi:tetratricopeptide (TPR) repeat protein
MKTGQVFISHTSDMAARPPSRTFVQAALDAVSRAGMASVDMRYFAARDGRPADYCRVRVRQCEVFVAVVGLRYGSVVPGLSISYTELEFEAATTAGLPRLVFLLEGADGMESGPAGENGGEIGQFRQRLRSSGLVLRTFSSDDSLELEIFHALSELNIANSERPSIGLAAATRTLPRDIASFTGRDPEYARLVEQAASAAGHGGVVGICAIGGMAGIGKTALAVHAAHLLAPRFPDGQIFLPLHGHTPGHRPVDPADALASLLQTAGLAAQQIPRGLEERARLWRDRLAGKRLLLILDDAAGHEQVRPLLPGTAGTLVLITSRRHLSALEDAQVISLDTLSPEEARRLLVRLAARPGLDHGSDAVQDIARLCGHLPLAIGMLARQLHHHPAWSVAELARDLASARSRLTLMQTENLSVTAAFDLSYQDLNLWQQQLFRRLGLHPGTDFDRYAAAALDSTDSDTAGRGLQDLYDHYLLIESAPGRYRFHDLIGEHARTLSATDPPAERDAAVERLLRYYLHAARISGLHLTRRIPVDGHAAETIPTPDAPDLSAHGDAAAWMDAERVNLHAAVTYAAAGGCHGYAVAIPAVMHGYLRHQGHKDQVLALHRIAVEAAGRRGDRQAEANALTDLGDIQQLSGHYRAAIDSLTRAIQLRRGGANEHGEAHALSILGFAQYVTGNNLAAADNLARALDIYGRQGDQFGEAATLAYISRVQQTAGDYQAAKTSLERALEIQVNVGNRVREAGVRNFLGHLQCATGDYAAAADNQALALRLYQGLGNKLGEGGTLRDLGFAQHLLGDHVAAAANLTRALQLQQEIGHRVGEAQTRNYLGLVMHLAGDDSAAATSLTVALDMQRELGNSLGEAEALNALGEVTLATGDPAKASDHHRQAIGIATTIAALAEKARALEGLGRSQLQGNQRSKAAESLHQALDIYQGIGSPNADRTRILIRNCSL